MVFIFGLVLNSPVASGQKQDTLDDADYALFSHLIDRMAIPIPPPPPTDMILQKAIHAEMHRYVSRFKSGVDPNNRARLFQLYKHYKDLELNTGEIQHIYMTENYIIPIAKALRSIDGNRYPMEYYKSFAWDGLRLWDANGLLSMEMDSIYYSYRNIVVNNSILGCD